MQRIAIVFLAVMAALPASLIAQRPDSVAVALQRRDAGDLGGAAAILRRQVERDPADQTATRALAQTLYWLHDVPTARATYEQALGRWPDDQTLRLDFARLLVDSGDRARAVAILDPLERIPATRARAAALLGTAAYWAGDLDEAERLLAIAAADPSQGDARRQLAELRTLAAPRLRVDIGGEHDNQPLGQLGVAVEGSWFATPLTPFVARIGATTYRSTDTLQVTALRASIGISRFLPAERLELHAMIGLARHAATTDLTGRLGAGVRFSPHLALRARAERDAYLFTVASQRIPVTTGTLHAGLALTDLHGWLGEVAAELQRFPDANIVRTGYAWALAPVLSSRDAELKLGYGVTAQDADVSRYLLPAGRTTAIYSPYYTPAGLLVHSALASGSLRLAPHARLRVNGSYGFSATEDAPTGTRTIGHGGGVTQARGSYRRGFAPWDLHAGITLGESGPTSVSLLGETSHTAFYTRGAATVRIERRLRT